MDLISLKLKCSVCGESLMDKEQTVDNSPSIKLNIKAADKKGTIWLSSVYESYNYECDIDIPKDKIVEFSCPHCNSEIKKDTSCDICEADMYYLNLHMGGKVSFCSRNGCKNHSVEFNQISTALKSLYQKYSYSGFQQNAEGKGQKPIEETITEENGIKEIIETGTFLPTYCPHCKQTFNVENKGEKKLIFKAVHKGHEIDLCLSPYLDIFEIESSVPIKEDDKLDDLICPKCNKSLINKDVKCGECDSSVGEIIITAYSKLIPFFICVKYGCQWHGLTKADERKIKLKIPRQEMPEQDQTMRVHNYQEVPYGYTSELASLEAGRCLQCKKPKCVDGCPVNIDIPNFIRLIAGNEYDEAVKLVKDKNLLPAICGRVCPQESQCEELCILGIKGTPVAIGNLERFVADFERKMDLVKIPRIKKKLNKRVAVVGSGPGGLTVAADLIQLGYGVTVYEALHETGGVLTYGIPEFRLPKSIVQFEINVLKEMGVRFELNHIIGPLISVDELLENFQAVFIAVGAGLPWFMGLPGENLINIFSSNEYLTRMNLMRAYKFPEYDTPMPKAKKIIVIGGGNVAMDCARTAIRCGSEEVTIVYRRSRKELPARHEEVKHAEEEGVIFKLLTNPVKYIGTDNGKVKAMECIKMKLGAPDDSGRRRPVPIDDSNFVIECDLIIVAIGTGPNPTIFQDVDDIKRNRKGYININPKTMETSKEFVYAGGDIVTGSATVIEAMGAGRVAADAIHKKLLKK